MSPIDERKAKCQACPHFRRGQVRLETWCEFLDDQPGAARNCEASRFARWQSRLVTERPTCGPWGEPGWIHLPSIPTLVYTTDKPHCVARHPRVRQILDSRGFTNWKFFWGQAGTPYWAMIRPEYAALLRTYDPPLTILEDDIAVRDFRAWIKPPPQTEVVYLGGGGSWPGGRFVRAAQQRLPGHKIYRVREIGWEDIDRYPEWARVFGMFGTHAMTYLDKRVMLEMAQAIDDNPLQVDVIFGENQWRWQCMLRRVPIFWQDDGHNGRGTYEYGPPPNSNETREARMQRLRRERRAALRR